MTLFEFHIFLARNFRGSLPAAKFCISIVVLLLFLRYKVNLLVFFEEVKIATSFNLKNRKTGLNLINFPFRFYIIITSLKNVINIFNFENKYRRIQAIRLFPFQRYRKSPNKQIKTDMEKDSPRFLEPRAVLSEKLRVRGSYRVPMPVHYPE